MSKTSSFGFESLDGHDSVVSHRKPMRVVVHGASDRVYRRLAMGIVSPIQRDTGAWAFESQQLDDERTTQALMSLYVHNPKQGGFDAMAAATAQAINNPDTSAVLLTDSDAEPYVDNTPEIRARVEELKKGGVAVFTDPDEAVNYLNEQTLPPEGFVSYEDIAVSQEMSGLVKGLLFAGLIAIIGTIISKFFGGSGGGSSGSGGGGSVSSLASDGKTVAKTADDAINSAKKTADDALSALEKNLDKVLIRDKQVYKFSELYGKFTQDSDNDKFDFDLDLKKLTDPEYRKRVSRVIAIKRAIGDSYIQSEDFYELVDKDQLPDDPDIVINIAASLKTLQKFMIDANELTIKLAYGESQPHVVAFIKQLNAELMEIDNAVSSIEKFQNQVKSGGELNPADYTTFVPKLTETDLKHFMDDWDSNDDPASLETMRKCVVAFTKLQNKGVRQTFDRTRVKIFDENSSDLPFVEEYIKDSNIAKHGLNQARLKNLMNKLKSETGGDKPSEQFKDINKYFIDLLKRSLILLSINKLLMRNVCLLLKVMPTQKNITARLNFLVVEDLITLLKTAMLKFIEPGPEREKNIELLDADLAKLKTAKKNAKEVYDRFVATAKSLSDGKDDTTD